VSTRYLLPCECGRKIPVQATQAGKRVRCACGGWLDVPTLRKIRLLEQQELAEGPPPQRGFWGQRQRIALLGGVALAAAAVWIGALLLYRPVMPSPPDPRTLTPLESFALWEKLLQGPDAGGNPQRRQYERDMATWWHWCAVAVALAVVATMVIAAAGLWRPGKNKSTPVRRH